MRLIDWILVGGVGVLAMAIVAGTCYTAYCYARMCEVRERWGGKP